MAKRPTKYIFVTGGVLSGLGKGITAASIGNILKSRGLSVNIQKLDPYLNVDAGTLNPAEHGECFVTADGSETDLDLGHYERFLDVELTSSSSVMSGRVLRKLIQDERDGKYLGKTVQVVPHFTDAIQNYIDQASQGFDVHIVEIGGTVGDYESPAFFEAIREYRTRAGQENCINVQVVYLPYLAASKEIKTKPAQNATRELRSMGIMPDLLVARCEESPNSKRVKQKLSTFCGVSEDGIALLPNAKSVYQVPLTLEDQGIGDYVVKKLGLKHKRSHMKEWRDMVATIMDKPSRKVKVGLVAKYLDNEDTYICVIEALKSAGWHSKVGIEYHWIDAEKCEAMTQSQLKKTFDKVDGIIVPGGFGERALEGKIKAAQYALKHKVPYLGLCLGLQMAVIAAARNAGVSDATSTELNSQSDFQVVSTMNSQKGLENTGGTMRLGNYPCDLDKDSLTAKYYKSKKIIGRHRHRYECNNEYRESYKDWGIKAVGLSPDKRLVEVIEGVNHPFFVASQFHPEFNSRPNKPQPLFKGFVESLLAKKS
ncbi:MAG TPA: CTP synthase [Candidatus Saccharibacteria bacterium]|nr:CTP synthase [Candidatus Saccharibacteria bacterium]